MNRTARISVVATLAFLTVASLAWQIRDVENLQRTLAPTTFGQVPNGYGALFDLLSELDLPVVRSYEVAGDLPAAATVWWIEPFDMCPTVEPKNALGERDLLEHGGWPGGEWIREGGTAVVFLPANESCDTVVGVALPPRQTAEDPLRVDAAKGTIHVLDGDVLSEPRRVETPPLRTFKDAGDWRVRAAIEGRPFVLEHALGDGHIIVVGDASFLRNAWLDHADAAPLAVDLVRAFGVPRFDERQHGLRSQQSAVRYIAGSPARAVFLGLALLGVLFAWRGNALPPRTTPRADPAAPTMDAFVDSLAALYARTGDYARVLERYRELTAARLRRHFGLPEETPLSTLVDRLRTHRQLSANDVRLLVGGPSPSSDSVLRAAVRSLDALVLEATR